MICQGHLPWRSRSSSNTIVQRHTTISKVVVSIIFRTWVNNLAGNSARAFILIPISLYYHCKFVHVHVYYFRSASSFDLTSGQAIFTCWPNVVISYISRFVVPRVIEGRLKMVAYSTQLDARVINITQPITFFTLSWPYIDLSHKLTV